MIDNKISRRTWLRSAAGVTAGTVLGGSNSSSGATRPRAYCTAVPNTVRDRLWLFGIPANTAFPFVGRRSLMTPVEGAFYLGIPNVLMIQVEGGEYGRFSPPYEQYAVALAPMKRMGWSITGSTGVTSPQERSNILELAKRTPNFVTLYMDDFFHEGREGDKHNARGAMTFEELKALRVQARASGKPLELWVTLYTHQLRWNLADYLALMDGISLWTENPQELVKLNENLQILENLAPRARKALGCYMFDFPGKKPLTVDQMRLQCETGLRLLRDNRISAMIFLTNAVADLGYEGVEWTREWIAKVGEHRLAIG